MPDPRHGSPWDQVPVLPVVVPLGVVVLALLLWRLHRRAALTALRAAVGHGLFRLALLVPALGRLVRAATWPPAHGGGTSTPGGLGEPAGSRAG